MGEMEVDVEIMDLGQEAAIGVGLGKSGDDQPGAEVSKGGSNDQLKIDRHHRHPSEVADSAQFRT